MKLHVMMFFNKKIECYTQPHFIDIEPAAAAVQLKRNILETEDLKVVNTYKNLDLYHVAEFDDETGDLVPVEKVRLLDCTEVIGIKEKKEGVKYGDSQPIQRN